MFNMYAVLIMSALVLFIIWVENYIFYPILYGMQNIQFIPLLFRQVSYSQLLKP